MSWQSRLWARWLGWTLLLGLVCYGLAGVGIIAGEALSPIVSLVFLVLSSVMTFFIGSRLRSFWWVAAPLVLFLAPIVIMLLTTVGPQVAGPTPIGEITPRESLLFLLAVLIPGLVMAILVYSTVAALGVVWGRRRQERDVAWRQ
jgi:hypothetical protein